MVKLIPKNLITLPMALAGLIFLFGIATCPVIFAQAKPATFGLSQVEESMDTHQLGHAGLAHASGEPVDVTSLSQPGGVYTVEVRVAASSDDAEERVDGSVSLSSSDLELVYDSGGDQTVGMRFNRVSIPPGAAISKAYVQFQVDETHSGPISLTIQAEDVDDALTFTSASGNIASRPRTSAAASWSPNPWMTIGEAGLDQQMPDIASVIREIIDRPGWANDNSLAIIITGTGERGAESYDGDPAGAPLLHVEYTSGLLKARPGVSIITPANNAIFNNTDTITFTATATDAEDRDLTAGLLWESSIDGLIGAGGSFSRTELSLGGHTITATASGGEGLTAFDHVTISIVTDTTVLVGAGDIAGCGSQADLETALLLDHIGGTVFTLGDNVYPDGTDLEFSDCYDPTWGRHKARTRPAAGNHDYHTPGASGYFNYFGLAAGEVDKGYYSYNVGAWHIIVLNSQCAEVGGCDSGSPQWQWLQADLAANPAACTLAYWHHPRFSSSSKHGSDVTYQDFWQLLYDAGADVVLNGHDHTYERFAPQDPTGNPDPGRGIREFVVGTGGGGLYTFDTPEPNSEVRESNTHGVLKLTLHPTSYEWEFVPIAGQTFTDTGSASCVVLNDLPVVHSVNPGSILTLAAVADAWVLEADPDTNHGTAARLDVDSPGEESYIRFRVTGVTGAIQSARLRMFVTDKSSDGPGVYGTDNSWTETGITWNNRPQPTTGVLADVGAIEANVWVEYDVTAAIAGDGTYSFVFLPDSANGVTFSSREGSLAPELVLTFAGTPWP
jgi:hypothetical protein